MAATLMKYALASYYDNGSRRAALVVDETLYDLADAFGVDAPSWARGSVDDVVAHWEEASESLESLESMSKPASNPVSGKLDAPLRPTRIFAAASNYIEHADEMGTVLAAKKDSNPYMFTKMSSTVIGPGEAVCIPPESQKVDWEVELGVVIGKRGRRIPLESALDYVAGYTVVNDISARDLTKRTDFPFKFDWFQGKNFDQGMFDFGYGDPLAVILNRSQGGTAKMVGAINQGWPAALCYVKGRQAIETPADLRGLTIGGGRSSPMQVLLPMWLGANGVDVKDVIMMQLDPAVVIASLLEGQIDAGECWRANSIPLFEKRAKEADVEIEWIEYGAFGLDIYGNGLVTSETLIDENPDVVEKFVRATYQGYAFVLENPEEATRIVLEHYPILDPEVTRQQINELSGLITGTETATLGWLEEDKVARTLKLVSEAYELEASLSPLELYTTEFLQ